MGPYPSYSCLFVFKRHRMLKVLTRKEVADLLKLSTRTIDFLVASKQIPHKRVGRSVRFSERAIEQWMEQDNGEDFRKVKSA